MNIENWKEGLAAWQKIKDQAAIDIEQADLYISAIQKKIKELEKENGK